MPRLTPHLALGLLSLGLLLPPGDLALKASAAPAAEAPRAHGKAIESTKEGAHGGNEPKKPDILALDLPLEIWSLVVFVVLFAVLGKFAWGPLLTALQKREENLTHTLSETERARTEAENLLAEHRSQMAQAADQVRALIEQGRRDAEASAAEIVRKAQAEAEAARDRAQREIGTARDQALNEIWTKTADLAVSVAGKVLSKELSGEDQRRLVELATNELPAHPGETNGAGGQRA